MAFTSSPPSLSLLSLSDFNFVHIIPLVPDCTISLFASVLPLPPAPSSSPLPFLFRGACICHGARYSQDIFSINLLLLPCLFLAPLCVFSFSMFEFACNTAGSPPSLDTVSESLRTQVYHWQDACLQRHCECGCLP